jgi:hypothetical protein
MRSRRRMQSRTVAFRLSVGVGAMRRRANRIFIDVAKKNEQLNILRKKQCPHRPGRDNGWREARSADHAVSAGCQDRRYVR